MNDLSIALTAVQPPDPDGSVDLKIKVGETVLTHLLRGPNRVASESLRCPSAPLAFWFADNWWRHRWESKPTKPSADWRMAHEMMAIGHGNAWPNVTLWGDRERVMLISKADASGIAGPVRFLTNAVTYAPATAFEAAIDTMLEHACRIVPREQRESLSALLAALRDERADSDIAAWRRLEAVNGYRPDEAPDGLVEALLTLEGRFLAADVEEASAAAAGEASAERLNAALTAAEKGTKVDFAQALRMAGPHARAVERLEPWVMAEAAAQALRGALGRGVEPLRRQALSDLLGMSASHLEKEPAAQAAPYALRLAPEGKVQTVLLTAKWAHDRRFQAARALGDAIWSEGSALGVVSTLGSARQKFQRAFAAALLCPEQGLVEFLDSADPSDGDITEAARHFHVSERTVRSVLVNKHIIDRHCLGRPLVDPQDSLSLDALADAA
jgi:CBS domain-containing protein